MSQFATIYPYSNPKWGDSSFGSSGLKVGLTNDESLYYGIIPFPALDPTWHILSLKLLLQRTDTYSTHVLRFGSNESLSWADRNTLDWSYLFTIGSGANTKTLTLTSYIEEIAAYTGNWNIHIAHGSGSNSYSEFAGGITGTAPRLVVEYEVASITPSGGSLSCGVAGSLSVMTPPNVASYELRYELGETSDVIATIPAGETTVVPWTPPASLANQITTDVSALLTLQLYVVGGTSAEFSQDVTLLVPDSMVPTISDAVFSLVNPVDDTIGIYVQGRSKTSCAITAASVYGATIVSYRLVIAGQDKPSEVATVLSDALAIAGVLNAAVSATDSRGRTVSLTITGAITVYTYAKPLVTGLSVSRCLSDGTLDNAGTYFKATITCVFSALNSLNTRAATIKHGLVGGTMGEESAISLPSTGNLYSFSVDVVSGSDVIGAAAYLIVITLTDRYNTSTEDEELSSSKIYFDVHNDGEGVTFGAPATEGGKDIFKLPVRFDNDVTFGEAALLAFISLLQSNGLLGTDPQKMQIGVTTSNSSGVAVTFPVEFPGTPHIIPMATSATPTALSATGISTTGFTARSTAALTSYRWYAICVPGLTYTPA